MNEWNQVSYFELDMELENRFSQFAIKWRSFLLQFHIGIGKQLTRPHLPACCTSLQTITACHIISYEAVTTSICNFTLVLLYQCLNLGYICPDILASSRLQRIMIVLRENVKVISCLFRLWAFVIFKQHSSSVTPAFFIYEPFLPSFFLTSSADSAV